MTSPSKLKHLTNNSNNDNANNGSGTTERESKPESSGNRKQRHLMTILISIIIFGMTSTFLSHTNMINYSSNSSKYNNIERDLSSFLSPRPPHEQQTDWSGRNKYKPKTSSSLHIIPRMKPNTTRTKMIRRTDKSGSSYWAVLTKEEAELRKQQQADEEEVRLKSTQQDHTKGMHICTCLHNNNNDNTNNKLPKTPKRIRWLHIPKTGTSFITTLWSYTSSTNEKYIDLNVNSFECGNWADTAYSMYDFVLMRRYPWEMYGALNMIPVSSSSTGVNDEGDVESSSSTNHSHAAAAAADASNNKGTKVISSKRRRNTSTIDKNIPLGLVGGTQHLALAPNIQNKDFTKSNHFQKVKHTMRQWGSEVYQHNITVVSFFRQPEDRIVSAYYDGRHSSGFKPEMYQDLVKKSYQQPGKHSHSCKLSPNNDDESYHNPLECFARYPGIAGCMSRMLTGETCADGILQLNGYDNLASAIDIVLNELDFVGLMEDWNESICQFHRLYGGKKLQPDNNERHWNIPLQGEFSNKHKSTKSKVLGIKDLHGFKDVADTVLYEAVKLKFERMVDDSGGRCYRYMTWDEIKADKMNVTESSSSSSVIPYDIKLDSASGDVCRPKSCSDMGKQVT